MTTYQGIDTLPAHLTSYTGFAVEPFLTLKEWVERPTFVFYTMEDLKNIVSSHLSEEIILMDLTQLGKL